MNDTYPHSIQETYAFQRLLCPFARFSVPGLSLADDLRGISFNYRMREFIYTINATIAKHPTENAIFFALSFLSYRFIAFSSAIILSRFIVFLLNIAIRNIYLYYNCVLKHCQAIFIKNLSIRNFFLKFDYKVL